MTKSQTSSTVSPSLSFSLSHTDTDQDCWILHGDAGSRGSQGSTNSMVVLETDLGLSCSGENEELLTMKTCKQYLTIATMKFYCGLWNR